MDSKGVGVIMYEKLSVVEFVAVTETFYVKMGAKAGNIGTTNPKVDKKAWIEYAKQNKPAIIEYLQQKEKIKKAEQQQRAEEYRKKLEKIEGLAEIERLTLEWQRWQRKFNASFESEDGGGVGVGNPPKEKVADLMNKYPVAEAYLRAKAQATMHNLQLNAIGEKAMQAILNNPEKYKEIIEQMKQENDKFVNYHIGVGD